MQHQSGNAQGLAAFEFVGEGADAAQPRAIVRRGQVQLVACMGNNRCHTRGTLRRSETLDVFVSQRRRPPLPLVLNENLYAIAAQLNRGVQGVLQPAGHGKVRPQQ